MFLWGQGGGAHKNGWLEYEHVTPIEACSPVKIIELYQK